MHPIASRPRLALLTLAVVSTLALSGRIGQTPTGVHTGLRPGWPRQSLDGTVLTGVVQQGPRGLLGATVPLTGVIVTGGVPR